MIMIKTPTLCITIRSFRSFKELLGFKNCLLLLLLLLLLLKLSTDKQALLAVQNSEATTPIL
jgi:hypothetical protein